MIQYPGSGIALSPTIPAEAMLWRNDYEVRRWCRQYTLIDQGSHEKWLASIVGNPEIKMFSICAAPTNLPVGVCGLTSIDRVNQSAEFSLYIKSDDQKKGYGSHALASLLRHGFEDFNLNRIWGETFDGNPAMKMFETLGMKREGTFRKSYFREGRFIDSHIYGLLREDFKWPYT